jgi:hypothetical protein
VSLDQPHDVGEVLLDPRIRVGAGENDAVWKALDPEVPLQGLADGLRLLGEDDDRLRERVHGEPADRAVPDLLPGEDIQEELQDISAAIADRSEEFLLRHAPSRACPNCGTPAVGNASTAHATQLAEIRPVEAPGVETANPRSEAHGKQARNLR